MVVFFLILVLYFIKMVDNLVSLNVNDEGKRIRNSALNHDGVNVNFVKDSDNLEIRTYERGVEEEL